MKKLILTALTVFAFVSCQSDEQYENYNRDTKNPTQVKADFLFNSATKSLFDQMTSTNVNSNIFRLLGQHWTETTYVDEANYDFNTRSITASHWNELYRDVLLDLKAAKDIVNADDKLSSAQKKTRNAQIEILTVYAWANLVENFGDIPYTQALDPGQFALPTYDKAETIYTDLIQRLTLAIPALTDDGFGTVDPIYSGNSTKWKKFGNSLLLRMGIRVADVASMNTISQTAIRSAIAGGVINSNADNAAINYAATSPNTNPVWVDLVQSGRSDFVIANTIVDAMNSLNDPRRTSYFDENLGTGVFLGGPYGDNNSFTRYTHVSDRIIDPTNPASLIDYSEVSFYLADAAERSISGTPAQAVTFYNQGITASFDYWGATGVTSYLANPNVNYATAPGTWKVKIGKQLWLAMYNRGYEAWTAWRQYDFPGFIKPAVSGADVPTRLTYPLAEQNLNTVNYNAGSTSIGGDKQTTKLFWDKF
ncbi:SusD/RagB family nutrient-binding outer membrane lipoprotein [Flavobacterium sp. CAN_S2]|uniref:SusD/RagB family nutrient-binding outer membrane lipoprotein n=1 Tax=Flavobacterium sp. CAN_S2 TaxID=2787726 RepID=UPI0018CA8073